MVDTLHEQMEVVWCKHDGIEFKLRWMQGHQGILGNEWVDQEAEKVAQGESSLQQKLPMSFRRELLTSCLAVQQWHMKKVNAKSVKCIKNPPRC